MEILAKRQISLAKALASLDESLRNFNECKQTTYYKSLRDSNIKRFEYCIDGFWKFIKEYMTSKMGELIEVSSPKPILKRAHTIKLIDSDELVILNQMIDDRNQTSHAYNEDLAENMNKSIPQYYQTMNAVFNRLNT